jgi:RNA polymerase sigma-70 factor (ECF subfamily)
MRDMAVTDLGQLERPADEGAVALHMDEETFRLFYQRTSRPLWAYLSRVSRDRQLADDLLQETYYRFLKSGRRFESDDHRRHYLFRIATNLLLDARRRPQPRFSELPGEADARAPRAADAGDEAICRADLSAAMGRLAPRDRALLWLAYAQGASHGEIAASTGLKASSVRQLLFRARRRLAALMGVVR